MTKLNKEDIKRIMELRDKGVSFRELGRMFDVSYNAIFKRMKELSPSTPSGKVDSK